MDYSNQLEATVAQMQAQGMSMDQIKVFLQKVQAAGQAEAEAAGFSQKDGITIRQAEPDAVGTYVPTEVVSQDLYAEAMRRGADVAPRSEGLVGGPPRAGAVDVRMGNPNYKVEDEGQRVGVNASGHIVHY